jgi:nitroimidazol reductase NimA-like FMN-containing flavoprotein (pyridoxamine 5'-phosphate oxidase superfamily)
MLEDEGLELLEEAECWALLADGNVGRVGVTVGTVPAIFPVNFVIDRTSIVFRTGTGTKLAAAAENALVAFECDRVDPITHGGWSVLAAGVATRVTAAEEIARLSNLGLCVWPGGNRDQLIRIPVEFVSGRRILLDGKVDF